MYGNNIGLDLDCVVIVEVLSASADIRCVYTYIQPVNVVCDSRADELHFSVLFRDPKIIGKAVPSDIRHRHVENSCRMYASIASVWVRALATLESVASGQVR